MPLPVLALLAALATGTFAIAQSPSGDKPALGEARDTLARWVETQQIISKEKRDWFVAKEVLEQRIALLKSEIGSLEAKVAETRGGLRETDERRREIVSQAESFRAASAALVDRIGPMEARTRALVKRLPEPIQQRVGPLAQRIPAEGTTTDLSLSTRFQNVIGVLNELNKFNQDIHVTSELRELADGRTAEVKALYIGLGQGYYVTSTGDAAGVGRAGPDGWTWNPANELAPEIARAIGVLENTQVPAYVPLPVSVE
ncbi:MAG: DUF3450 domain-containing protein [Acidobacteria bacterium]|nr:DUF3450 domain-containing protein [Acidobacteriota bacterium]